MYKVPNYPIEVYDDEVPFSVRMMTYEKLFNSDYRIQGWQDRHNDKYDLHTRWSIEDLRELNFLPIVERLAKGKHIDGIVCNLVRAGDTYYSHIHKDQTILLYYANLDWEEGWHGETLFYDAKGEEIVYTSRYKAGRIILFSDDQPHAIRPQSFSGPQFRFTVSIILETDEVKQKKNLERQKHRDFMLQDIQNEEKAEALRIR